IDPALVTSGNTSGVVSFVNNYKGNPAVVGWLLSDEPEFNRINSTSLVTLYQAIKAADPVHPVAIVFGDGWCSYIAGSIDSNYFNALDIVMFDKYPISDQAEFQPLSDNSLNEYAYEVNDCINYLASRGKGQKFIQVAQAFNWNGTGPNGKPTRDPTYGE